jgi:hypothetical protein
MATNTRGPGKYTGVERRREERRKSNDRRDLVRWEPKKDERRRGNGRRTSDGLRRPRG